MSKIAYIDRTFSDSVLGTIHHANTIIEEYTDQGFRLTLRQLYYQFVSRDLMANRQSEYKRLGDVLSKARLAGLVDWDAIEDRGRNIQRVSTWERPSQILATAAQSYREEFWRAQPIYVEAWIEKEALAGVIEGVCNRWRIPFFSCKGYVSQSEMHEAGRERIRYRLHHGKTPVILHLGDHDPSGIDMTRDIEDRLALFVGKDVEVRRLALNWDQIEEYGPPPNPAKVTDSRFEGYRARYGSESWELDALEPAILSGLIDDAVKAMVDLDAWRTCEEEENDARRRLDEVRNRFECDGA